MWSELASGGMTEQPQSSVGGGESKIDELC